MTTIDSELIKIGPRIRTIRKERGFKQKCLAKRLEVKASFLNRLEKSKQIPSLDMLIKIARMLKVAPTVFFSDLPSGDTSSSDVPAQIVAPKEVIPLFKLKDFHYFSTLKCKEPLRFGTEQSDLAGVRLDNDSMLPEYSLNDIVIIDRHFDCKTDWETGDRNLLEKKITSGMYVICHIAKKRFDYPQPNNLLRRIQFDGKGEGITLWSPNKEFSKHLKVRADSKENNVDVLHILGVVIVQLTTTDSSQ